MKKLFMATLLVVGAVSTTAFAQDDDYPSRPVRMIVPAPPGASPDILGRLLANKLSAAFGKSFVVENFPGSGGAVAAAMVAKTRADPYLLFFGDSGAMAINVALNPNLPYHPLQDFSPITALFSVPTVLVANPALKVSALSDVIKLAKEKPGALDYASAGPGSIQHMTMEVFAATVGIKLNHVAYKSSTALLNAVITGEVQLAWQGIPVIGQSVSDGKLTPLAISALQRSPAMPNVPTAVEQGVQGFDIATVVGLQTTAGVSPKTVARLQAVVAKGLRDPDIAAVIARIGVRLAEDGTAAYAQFMREDIARYVQVVKATGIKSD